jgi:hypothetical protein
MAVVKELIRKDKNSTLSFGDYLLPVKTKKADFEFQGDLYKIKTFKEITKLERNGSFVYESVPGTAVSKFKATENKVEFVVESYEDVSITLELEPSTEYRVIVDNVSVGTMMTNLGGKLSISLELDEGKGVSVSVEKC